MPPNNDSKEVLLGFCLLRKMSYEQRILEIEHKNMKKDTFIA